jgi:hypothetical protein
MADYRIYDLDWSGGIVWGRHFLCANDDEALAEATRGQRMADKVEVWTGTRCVGVLLIPGERSTKGYGR